MNWNKRNHAGLTPIEVTLKNNDESFFDILMEIPAVDKSVLPPLLVKKSQNRKRKAINVIGHVMRGWNENLVKTGKTIGNR